MANTTANNKNRNCFAKGIFGPRRSRKVISREDGRLHTVRYTGPFFDATAESDIRNGLHQMIDIFNPNLDGTFISAQVSKAGGRDDDTWVYLGMGAENPSGLMVVEMSFEKARILGLEKRENPFGITLHVGKKNVQTLTIGFDTPLHFGPRLQLFVRVSERGVSKVESTVVWGAEGGGGGDLTGGNGGGEDPFP